MKVKFCLFLLLLFAASTQAQRQVKVYLDEKGKLTKDESTASYYRIITFNKNNKSGVSKGYTTSGKIMYVGKFLSTDLNNLLNDVPDGECIWYHENGTKARVSKYINRKEVGNRAFYNEEGKLEYTIPLINGITDDENMLSYTYFSTYYSTLKGKIIDDKYVNGECTIYSQKGDTVITFLKHSTMEMPNWIIRKPFQKDKIGFAVFEDNFSNEQKSTFWSYLSDEKANIEFLNNQLHISFKYYNFPRSIQLDDVPVSLNDNDFSITVKISKESNALGQGIEFGIANNDNLYRFGIQNLISSGKLIYEKLVDGNFVEDATIEKIYYKTNEDNELSIKKKDNKIIVSVNGYIAYEIDNPHLLGNGIALFGGAAKNRDQAYFKNFKAKIELIKAIPTQISVKKIGGVYTLPIELNGVLKIDFIFDSGASDVSISPDIALTLVKAGTITEQDWLEGAYYKFADGSTAKSKRFKLKSLKIGSKLITNIPCSIANSLDAPMLLGQSVLGKFGKFTFDNKKQLLIFE